MKHLANCSLLFTEHRLVQRPAAARAAGFGAVTEFEDRGSGGVPTAGHAS
jgi:hydroxypyruvate isomerase